MSLSNAYLALSGAVDADITRGERLAHRTSYRIGGPAAMLAVCHTPEALARVIEVLGGQGVEWVLLGKGSNMLVADEGFDGCVVVLGRDFSRIEVSRDDATITAGAAVPLSRVVQEAMRNSLSGLEFACGIPGSVGGAVFMNAGAYDGCIADVLASATLLGQEGDVFDLPVEDLDLGYRASRVRAQGLVVLSATFALTPGDKWDICAKMADLTERRQAKQPLELPSAGSTFKRPEGHYAGKLITDAGLKGYRSGGAAVSTKHAGFVVNLGGATAADIRAVIAHVQDEVQRQFGVHLEPEVRFIGEF